MDESAVKFLIILLSTLPLYYFAIKHGKSKRIFLYMLPLLILSDLFLIYQFVNRNGQGHEKNELVSALDRYPEDVRKSPVSVACQAFQLDLMKNIEQAKSVNQDDFKISSLLVCSCITTQLQSSPKFGELESAMMNGKSFIVVFGENKDIFEKAISKCTNP